MGHAKLPDHIIEAFTYIKKSIPAAKLWMVGDGKMRKKLEKISQMMLFFLDMSMEKRNMSRAHAIFVPGVREGWGLVVTEANARGTPAIGYNVHGL